MEFDLSALWRQKITLVISTLAGIAVALAYLAYAPATYQVMARVLIQPQEFTPDAESVGRVDPEFLPTQAETIRSPVTLSEVLKSVTVTPPRNADPEEFDPIRHVLKSLTVTPVIKANVLTIAYRCTDPQEGFDIISALVVAYESHVASGDQRQIVAHLDVLRASEESLRDELEKVTEQYDELRRRSPMLGKGREADAQALLNLRRLTDELALTRRESADLDAKLAIVAAASSGANISRQTDESALDDSENAELMTLSTLGSGGLSTPSNSSDRDLGDTGQGKSRRPETRLVWAENDRAFREIVKFADVEDSRALQQQRDELTVARTRLAQLDQLYGPKHPDFLAAQRDVADYEQIIDQRLESIVRGWQQQLEVVKQSEAELQAAFMSEQRELKTAEDFRVQEEHLLSEITKVERLHTTALEQVIKQEAAQESVAAGRSSIEVLVIDAPALIDEMTWPQPKLLLATCAALGLVIGVCTVVLREMLSSSAQHSRLSSERSLAGDFVFQQSGFGEAEFEATTKRSSAVNTARPLVNRPAVMSSGHDEEGSQ